MTNNYQLLRQCNANFTPCDRVQRLDDLLVATLAITKMGDESTSNPIPFQIKNRMDTSQKPSKRDKVISTHRYKQAHTTSFY